MPVYIISIIIQVAFVLHIVKTGRSTKWIWIVVMLPMAGSIAYFIIEIFPEFTNSRSGQKAKRNVEKMVNPNKDMNQALQDYSIAETVENALFLAEAFINKQMFDEARQLYQKCLSGIHKYDPDIMYKLASVEFELKDFNEVKILLDELIIKNPSFKNADAHLLFAKVLEELNQTELALEEYKTLDSYYSGPEATYRYAMLLKKEGQLEMAIELFNKIVHKSKISGKHYISLHKAWVDKSISEIKN